MDFNFREVRGREIEPFLEELGTLRIEVFREFPYLYEGTLAAERDYLRAYLDSPQSLVVLLEYGDRIVGATTALPFLQADADFQAPFRAAGEDPAEIYYFGESVILPGFRGRGAGKEFFRRRESRALELGYRRVCFCAVDRPRDHPMRPRDYRSPEAFWKGLGYRKREDRRCCFSWKEVGQSAESPHSLTFWERLI